jgi:hypothetical protein
MAGDTANPRIWVNADVYVGPTTAPAPTDIDTALNAAFDAVGLLSEDGMTESREQEETDHYAYGGILVRTTRSKHKRMIMITALEDNPVVFDLVNPGSEVATSGGVTTRTVVVPSAPNPKSFVLELVDGAVTKRRYIPTAEVTSVGDVSISDNEMATYELTVTIYPDADGILYYDITDDPQAEETGS